MRLGTGEVRGATTPIGSSGLDHRQAADIVLTHQLDGLVNRRGRGDRCRERRHDVRDRRCDRIASRRYDPDRVLRFPQSVR